jgi:hypothetical protein
MLFDVCLSVCFSVELSELNVRFAKAMASDGREQWQLMILILHPVINRLQSLESTPLREHPHSAINASRSLLDLFGESNEHEELIGRRSQTIWHMTFSHDRQFVLDHKCIE